MKLTRENLKDFGIVPEGDVVIPVGITEIGAHTFCDCDKLVSVTIPNTVKGIGDGAFARCSELKSVNVPEGIDAIPCHLFYKCYSLESMVIPKSVTSISYNAFTDCSNLTIEVPATIKSIDDFTFAGVKRIIYHGTLPGAPWGAKYLNTEQYPANRIYDMDYDRGFAESLSRDHLKIPVFFTHPEYGWLCRTTFWTARVDDSQQLVSIEYPATFEHIHSHGWDTEFPKLRSVILPKSVKTIDRYAFGQCPNLDIEVPDTVIDIHEHAFEGAYNVDYHGNLPGAPWGAKHLNLGTSASKRYSNTKDNEPKTDTHSGKPTPVDSSMLEECGYSLEGRLVIPSELYSTHGLLTVTTVPALGFFNEWKLQSVVLPDTITTIEWRAFAFCTGLDIEVPATVKRIGKEAFKNVAHITYHGNLPGAPWGARSMN